MIKKRWEEKEEEEVGKWKRKLLQCFKVIKNMQMMGFKEPAETAFEEGEWK